jgi:hypothetical protein
MAVFSYNRALRTIPESNHDARIVVAELHVASWQFSHQQQP